MKRLKILVSAYACEPEKGSEPGIGWNVVNELAAYHEVHVLTRANNREAIENALAQRSGNKPIFHYYDLPRALSFWKKKRRGYHLYYYLWQYGAFFHFHKFIKQEKFDVVQHLTFANFAIPSPFMLTRHAATVWGPVSRLSIDPAVFKMLPLKIKIKERLRKIGMDLIIHLDIVRLLMPRAADMIIECGTPADKSVFPKRFAAKLRQHPQTGINPAEPEYQSVKRAREDDKIRLLICSEFIHWKGVIFSAEVFAALAKEYPNIELHIYGSGPEKANMEKIFSESDTADQVVWHGFVGKQEMLQALADADILLYYSYHHGLATVILQAMYEKLPIVALGSDSVALAVSEGAGLVADGKTPQEIRESMIAQVRRLIESPELRNSCGETGRKLIETKYNWHSLTAKLAELLTEAPDLRKK